MCGSSNLLDPERSNRFLRLRRLSLAGRFPASRAGSPWSAMTRPDSSFRATATSSYVSSSDCAKSHAVSRGGAATAAAATAAASSLNRDGRYRAAPARGSAPAPAPSLSSPPAPDARDDGRGLPDCACHACATALSSSTSKSPLELFLVSRGAIRLRRRVVGALRRSAARPVFDSRGLSFRSWLIWQAEIIVDLVYRTPELKDLIFMPAGRIKPYTVLPIGFRRRRHPNKPTRRPTPSALAKVYTGRQRRLPAISDPSQEYSCEMTVSKALDWVADIVDECLKAGRRPESHPLQTSRIEGVTVAPVLQTTLSSLTSPAINPGLSMAATQVQNAGSSLTSHVPTSSAPFLGTVCTPVPQTAFGSLTSCSSKSGMGSMANAGAIAAPISGNMFGSLARPAINPGMPSVANAGNLGSHVPTAGAPFLGNTCPPMLQTVFGKLAIARYYGNSGAGLIANSGPLAPVSQTMNLTNHAESSGAITTPVLQTMSCSLTRPINPGMSLMADADKLASHMPTPGAPFLGNMGASLSQNGFGSLTSHCESSGMAQIANTGATVCPVSQMTNLTSHCGETGAPIALAVQKNLASHAESSGSHVAPAVQTMNFASHAESSEINNSDQVGCNGTDQGFSLRENSREDITTTRACGEASPMPAIQT